VAVPVVRPAVSGFVHAGSEGPDAAAVARVEGQLRVLIWDGKLDPVADRSRVAALAAELVSADQHLSSTPDRPDEMSRSVRNLVESVSGFGPLQPYLDDPDVEELWTNERLAHG
jgi:pilus assembly protein CpaF